MKTNNTMSAESYNRMVTCGPVLPGINPNWLYKFYRVYIKGGK